MKFLHETFFVRLSEITQIRFKFYNLRRKKFMLLDQGTLQQNANKNLGSIDI